MQIIVMPAWMAGIQVRKDTSENICDLIPALHAGDVEFWKFCYRKVLVTCAKAMSEVLPPTS